VAPARGLAAALEIQVVLVIAISEAATTITATLLGISDHRTQRILVVAVVVAIIVATAAVAYPISLPSGPRRYLVDFRAVLH
jgi:cobyrinic acid a,c-diamide synthase